jgi:hypothetical protein
MNERGQASWFWIVVVVVLTLLVCAVFFGWRP